MQLSSLCTNFRFCGFPQLLQLIASVYEPEGVVLTAATTSSSASQAAGASASQAAGASSSNAAGASSSKAAGASSSNAAGASSSKAAAAHQLLVGPDQQAQVRRGLTTAAAVLSSQGSDGELAEEAAESSASPSVAAAAAGMLEVTDGAANLQPSPQPSPQAGRPATEASSSSGEAAAAAQQQQPGPGTSSGVLDWALVWSEAHPLVLVVHDECSSVKLNPLEVAIVSAIVHQVSSWQAATARHRPTLGAGIGNRCTRCCDWELTAPVRACLGVLHCARRAAGRWGGVAVLVGFKLNLDGRLLLCRRRKAAWLAASRC